MTNHRDFSPWAIILALFSQTDLQNSNGKTLIGGVKHEVENFFVCDRNCHISLKRYEICPYGYRYPIDVQRSMTVKYVKAVKAV